MALVIRELCTPGKEDEFEAILIIGCINFQAVTTNKGECMEI